MCNISRALLTTLLLGHTAAVQANTEQIWTEQRCAELRQASLSDATAQQQLQQHCAPKISTASSAAKVIPVQLDITAPAQQQPAVQSPPPRVQHNSTLETLGSSMLLVLVGFWLWMGRK
jgi:hypothetical protein